MDFLQAVIVGWWTAALCLLVAVLAISRRFKTHSIPLYCLAMPVIACLIALGYPFIPGTARPATLLVIILLCLVSTAVSYRPRPSRAAEADQSRQAWRFVARGSSSEEVLRSSNGPIMMAISLAGLWGIELEVAGKIVGCDVSETMLLELQKNPGILVSKPTDDAWQRTWLLQKIRAKLSRLMTTDQEADWVRVRDEKLGEVPIALMLAPDLLGLQQVLARLERTAGQP